MNLTEFFGRLHPLIVHLPIGFLLIAILLELFFRKKMSVGKQKVILFILMCGALGAIISAFFGWLLANSGGYNEAVLFWHRWLGIATAILAIAAWWSKYKTHKRVYVTSLCGLGVLLLLTGHFGGSLTHGSDYLVQPLKGDLVPVIKYIDKPVDSVIVYTDLIAPFIQQKCISCHSDSKQNGGLNLATYEALHLGGDNGKVIKNNVWDSEMFKRVTLSPQSKKFMPPKGIPLTFNETSLLKWWMEQGSKLDNKLSETEIPENIKNILFQEFKLDVTPKAFVESIKLESLTDASIFQLEEKGWNIKLVSPNSNLMEATISKSVTLTESMLNDLLSIKEHITWLKLGRTNVTNDYLKLISKFENLSDLRLDNTSISDEGLQHLSNLLHLESLNIYNTNVSDEGLNAIKKMKNLQRIYLWKTKVTPSGISNLQQNKPDLKIISG